MFDDQMFYNTMSLTGTCYVYTEPFIHVVGVIWLKSEITSNVHSSILYLSMDITIHW